MAPSAAAISPPGIPFRRREPSNHGGAAALAASIDLKTPSKLLSRRIVLLATTAMAGTSFLNPARAVDSWFVAPEQTTAEAEAAVAGHAARLLELRPLVESGSWRELQIELRDAAPLLKQDLYTIIQSRPRDLRPELRKLYTDLFNGVTRLDYAARSRDSVAADDLYMAIVTRLETILGRI
ncbi:psbQ-like protein 3, chloroplastic [Wolffia australiana]